MLTKESDSSLVIIYIVSYICIELSPLSGVMAKDVDKTTLTLIIMKSIDNTCSCACYYLRWEKSHV